MDESIHLNETESINDSDSPVFTLNRLDSD